MLSIHTPSPTMSTGSLCCLIIFLLIVLQCVCNDYYCFCTCVTGTLPFLMLQEPQQVHNHLCQLRQWKSPLAQLVERQLTMREVPGSNLIGDIAFFGGKTCSTVTHESYICRNTPSDLDKNYTLVLRRFCINSVQIKRNRSCCVVMDTLLVYLYIRI